MLEHFQNPMDRFQYRILTRISRHEPAYLSGEVYRNKSKIKVLLGVQVVAQLRGKVVIDFGCGEGDDAIEFVSERQDASVW